MSKTFYHLSYEPLVDTVYLEGTEVHLYVKEVVARATDQVLEPVLNYAYLIECEESDKRRKDLITTYIPDKLKGKVKYILSEVKPKEEGERPTLFFSFK